MEILRVIDIAGTAAFSIAGAFAALEKKLDVFGIFIIAFVTALVGGTLRDILTGNVPIRWMLDIMPATIVLISTTIAMLFTNAIKNFHNILLLFDSIGLGFFTVLGIQTGIDLGLHPAVCISTWYDNGLLRWCNTRYFIKQYSPYISKRDLCHELYHWRNCLFPVAQD